MKKKRYPDYEIQFFDGSWWNVNEFYAHLVSPGNREIIAPSQGYSSKQARLKTWGKLARRLKCKIVELNPEPDMARKKKTKKPY